MPPAPTSRSLSNGRCVRAVVSAVSAGRQLLSDVMYRVIIGACAVFLLYLGTRFVLGVFL